MENYAEAIAVMEESDIGSDNATRSSHLNPAGRLCRIDFPTVAFLDRVLFFVKAFVEYFFGIYIGSIAGQLFGRYTGNVYVTHFEPVYLSDFSELEQWGLIPYESARNGAVIGVVVGVIAIAIINSNLLSQRIVSLYQKGVTEPRDIARAFGKYEQRIRKKIDKLAKKGKITCQKRVFQKESALV